MKSLLLQIRTICIRLSKQNGQNIVLKSVELQTNARNLPALKFYEGCGYQRQALKAGYYGRVLTYSILNAYGRGKMPSP